MYLSGGWNVIVQNRKFYLKQFFQKGNYFDCMGDCMGLTDNNDRWSFMNQDFLISWIN